VKLRASVFEIGLLGANFLRVVDLGLELSGDNDRFDDLSCIVRNKLKPRIFGQIVARTACLLEPCGHFLYLFLMGEKIK